MSLDLSCLGPIPSKTCIEPHVSFEEAYGLLCGKSLRFDHVYGIVEMNSEDDVLHVSGQAMGHDVSWQKQLWLSEFALAYNLLSPPLPR